MRATLCSLLLVLLLISEGGCFWWSRRRRRPPPPCYARNCQVNLWNAWNSCSKKCGSGTQYRYRSVSVSPMCGGYSCPSTSASKSCSDGCAHRCSSFSGRCSCYTGYYLSSNLKSCRIRNCGSPSASYCPSYRTYGSTCKYPSFSCSSGTTYGKKCYVSCPSNYARATGSSSITCSSSGSWPSHSTIWCYNRCSLSIRMSSVSVAENASVGNTVGWLSSSDSDCSGISYQLVNSAGSRFRISGSRVLVNSRLNYESSSTHAIKIRATEPGGIVIEKPFTISILNVNESPTGISLSNRYVNENSAYGTVVGSFTTHDPDTGQSHSLTLLNSAGGRFRIQGNQLQVAVSNSRCLSYGGSYCSLNYEAKTSHYIGVRSRDSGTPSKYINRYLYVYLRNVNDRPRNLRLSGRTLQENATIGTVVGTLTASDEDFVQSLTYSLTNNAGGRFSISSGNKVVLATRSGIDYETATSHLITVLVKDSGSPSLSLSSSFSIYISNVNEPPGMITFSSTGGQRWFRSNSASVNENSAKTTVVGTLMGYDPDAGDKLAFGLDATSGGRFALKSSSAVCSSGSFGSWKSRCTVPVIVNGDLNYEVASRRTISVRLADEGNLIKRENRLIEIRNLNDPPRDIILSSRYVNENRNNAIVGTFRTIDEDTRDTFTYKLLNSAGGKFVLGGATLITAVNANLNYEIQRSYFITVQSTDSGKLSYSKNFWLYVNDVNESPGFVTITANRVAENSAQGTTVGLLYASDPDNQKQTRQRVTYALIDSAGGRFRMVGNTVQVAVSNARCLAIGGSACLLNYEAVTSHRIVVRATDNGSPPLWRNTAITIYLRNVNDRPRDLSINKFQVKEKAAIGTAIGTLTARDEDTGQRLSYRLTDSDGGRFSLKGAQLLKAKSTDYETKTAHSVVVSVTDNGSPPLSISRKITIEVLDEKEPPVSIRFSDTGSQLSFSNNSPRIRENSALNTVIGRVIARDQEKGVLTLSLDEDADGLFQLATSTMCTVSGGFTVCFANVVVAGSLNYEENNRHTVIVRATDVSGLHKAVRFTITVVDVNDKPEDITLSFSEILENMNGALVGRLTTLDEDSSQTHTYVLENGAGGRFIRVGSDIRVSSSANLDYETVSQYTISVKTSDNGSPSMSTSKNFVIEVLDVNEKPVTVRLNGNRVRENSGIGTTIGIMSVIDPDNTRTPLQTFSYTLKESAGSLFRVDNNVVKVAASNVRCLALGGNECLLNYERQNVYDIVVQATDSGFPPLSVSVTLSITVTDENDKPRNLNVSDNKVRENSVVGTRVGFLSADDEDGDSIAFSLSHSDNGMFRIVGNQLQTAKAFDYEISKVYNVTVVARDSGLPPLWISRTFLVDVLDANEQPAFINLTDTNGQLSFVRDKPRIDENTFSGTVVGTVVSSDPDTGDTLEFHLNDDAEGRFSLGNVTCRTKRLVTCWTSLVVAESLNYEESSSHSIEIRSTDSKGKSITSAFTIAVVNVNDGPEDILLSETSIEENQNSAFLGSLTTIDDDVGDSHTYALIKTAGGRFVIFGENLLTAADANLDYEERSEYIIGVRSTDSGSPPRAFRKKFTIKVVDVNEEPSALLLKGNKVKENSPKGTPVGTLSAVDPDNAATNRQTLTFTLVDSAGGRFAIEDGVVKVAMSNVRCLSYGGQACQINYESAQSHNITVAVTDDGNPVRRRDFVLTIYVTDANDKPRNLTIDSFQVDENEPVGTLVGNLSAFDEDVGDVLSFELLQHNVGFEIRGNELLKARSANYETKKSHNITVLVTDNGEPSEWTMKSFVIEVVDKNEAPVEIIFTDEDGQLSFVDNKPQVEENSPNGTVIGMLMGLDADAEQLLTFFLYDDDEGQFGILNATANCSSNVSAPGVRTVCSAKIITKNSFNYEDPVSHSIAVRATDAGHLNKTAQFFIRIVDVNEKPTGILYSGNTSVSENRIDVVLGYMATIDKDQFQSYTYTLADDAGGRFVVEGHILKVSSSANLDYEFAERHAVVVNSTDSGSPPLSVSETFVIQVLDVNEAPSAVILDRNTVIENSPSNTVIGNLSSVDSDYSQTHSYKLVDSSDGRFILAGNTLKTAVSNVRCLEVGGSECILNHEKAEERYIRVRATDSGSPPLSVESQLKIRVADANDRPRNLTLSSSEVHENVPAGTEIGTLGAKDEDDSQELVFDLAYENRDHFRIIGNELQMTITPNFEMTRLYSVIIIAQDNGIPQMNVSKTFSIEILDVNEPPFDVNVTDEYGLMNFSRGMPRVDENTSKGTIIGKVVAKDYDANDTLMFFLDDDSGGHFALETTTCQSEAGVADVHTVCWTTLVVSANLDYESDDHLQHINISVYDSGELSVVRQFVVAIGNVNYRPKDIKFSDVTQGSVKENQENAFVASLVTIDDDQSDKHTYELIGSANNRFTIDGNTLTTIASLDYEDESEHTVVIRSIDSGFPPLYVDKNFTIHVTDVNEAPSAVMVKDNDVKENSEIGTLVGKLHADDPDNARTTRQVVTFTMTDSASGRFMIEGDVVVVAISNQRCLAFGGAECKINYETAKWHNITIRAEDDGTPRLGRTFNLTIYVTDVNDQPRNLEIDAYQVEENETADTLVGSFLATDEDEGDVLSYTLLDDDEGQFKVNGSDLLKARGTDYETRKSHAITVEVTDSKEPVK
ncbi:protocadherin Fat 4-like isoform X2 [Oscarella lobularis]